MEKAVHSRPVSEEDETLSCSKKPRIEASPSSEDIEKYTIFTDSEYKLPLYLSQFALSVFNSKKEASYEKVNVVKTMKSLDVVNGTTYLATFEASLPNKSNNPKTFQSNIFMSPLDPITKLEVKFVRMKPSGFDSNGEEDSEVKDSESKEEGSEVEVSESKEEGSEEELSDESDEEDNEEKIGLRNTVGGKGPRQNSIDVKKSEVSESKEEGSKEEVSESDEEDFEEELSDESDEEDNEEKLFDESDEEDSEEELSDESDEEDNEEKLSKSDEKDTEEKNVVWGRKGPRRHRKYRREIKQYSKELSDESDEEDNEEKLSESDDKYIEEKPAVRKTMGGKGPRVILPVRKTVGGKGPRVPLIMCGVPRTYYYPPKWELSAASLNRLVYLSQLALCVYNMKEVTYYDNVKVLKAMKSGCMSTTYDITFEASLFDGNAITFQTEISMFLPFPYHKIEIEYVHPSINSDDILSD